MASDPRIIANEILLRAWDLGYQPTQIDVQKITYFLHGHHLQDFGEALVDTDFEAHQYGPVQRTLLECFNVWGQEPIGEVASKFDPVRRKHSPLPRPQENSVLATIDRHLEAYLAIASFDLVDITHAKDTPWSRTMQAAQNAVNIGMRISNDLILERFEGISAAKG